MSGDNERSGTHPVHDPSELSRGIPEVARAAGGGRGWWIAVIGLGGLVSVLALFAPGSGSESGDGEDLAGTRRVRAAPRTLELPPLERRTDWEEAVSSQDPSSQNSQGEVPGEKVGVNGVDSELLASLRREALEEAKRRRRLMEKRRRSSAVIYDRAPPEARGSESVRSAEGRIPEGGSEGTRSEGTQSFRERTGSDPRRGPGELRGSVIPQGTLIAGVLETSIQSDLPGMVRARVTRPVYALEGSLALRRGSTLIGEYNSGLVRGQTRVFVIWRRLLRPDGFWLELDSPGTDPLGRAGLSGELNTHFFEIFGASLVLSLIDGGLEIAAAKAGDSDNSTIVRSGGNDFAQAAELALRDRLSIPPTVSVAAGTPVQVFVARDLTLGDAGDASAGNSRASR